MRLAHFTQRNTVASIEWCGLLAGYKLPFSKTDRGARKSDGSFHLQNRYNHNDLIRVIRYLRENGLLYKAQDCCLTVLDLPHAI